VACLLILPAHPLDGMVMVPAGDFREMRAQLSAFGKVGVDFMAAPYRISLTVAVPTESPVARGFGSAITTQVLTSNEFTLSP
jgi:hypothetical protein